jgi:protein-L-isoaspartate(D-aspartate) O-methyltransferase
VQRRARSWIFFALPTLALGIVVGVVEIACKGGQAPDPSPPQRTTADAALPASSVESTPSAASAPDDDSGALRRQLVRRIETFDKPWGEASWDPRVLDAMRRVPRHRFMPGVSLTTAYQDTAYPIGHEQTISQPSLVALMTNALRLRGREKVLEIGTGSGYQAAVLSLLVAEVYSIEIVAALGREAASRLKALGYGNVTVRVGDGYRGWPEHAPFDRIVLTAAPPTIPAALVQQLGDGGILVAPVGGEDVVQRLERWTKRGSELEKEKLGDVRFVPMVPGKPK